MGAGFPDTVRELARRVRGPAEAAWGDGTQTDYYDQPEQVRFATQPSTATSPPRWPSTKRFARDHGDMGWP
jgi:hypothetical protein